LSGGGQRRPTGKLLRTWSSPSRRQRYSWSRRATRWSLYADGYTGRARRVVDDDRGYLLGVIFVGPGVEELINSATLVRGRPRSDQPALARRPMFPPISEAWLRLLEAYRS